MKGKYHLKAKLQALILRAFWKTCDIHGGDFIQLVSKDESFPLSPVITMPLEDFLKLLITHLIQGDKQLYPLEAQAAIDITGWAGKSIDQVKSELKPRLYPNFGYSQYSDYTRKALEHPEVDLPPGTDDLFSALKLLLS